MKKALITFCACLMLIIGLKDGRVGQIEGNPLVRFETVNVNGKQVQCAIVLIDGKAYPIPVELIEGMVWVADDKAM